VTEGVATVAARWAVQPVVAAAVAAMVAGARARVAM
jgi:hypothetical protein